MNAPPRPTAAWLRIAVIWMLFGVGYATQVFIDMQARGMHHYYYRMVLWGLEIGLFWALVTPIQLTLANRFPLERPHLFRSLLVHAPAYVLVAFVGAANHVGSAMLINPFAPLSLGPSFWENFSLQLRSYIPLSLFIYGVIAAAGHALAYRSRAQERELKAAHLETLLAQAQVLSLKTQLNPHFLFNTLNGIVAFVRENDGEAAEAMLMKLSSLLRYALDTSNRQFVPLSEEIDFLRQYLEIEQMRFPDRLSVEFDVPDDLLDASVPAMVLQPLAENAVRHGIGPRLAPGTIRVECRREGAELSLAILDDGLGLPAKQAEVPGIGIQNVRERLRALYGCEQKMTLVDRATGGVEARITIPFRRVTMEDVVPA